MDQVFSLCVGKERVTVDIVKKSYVVSYYQDDKRLLKVTKYDLEQAMDLARSFFDDGGTPQ